MDGSKPGEAGVIAWCNTIRFTMAKDPGRRFLHDQIQKEGFDFLDMYLENFLGGPRNEPVIELLKTPGRKKNAPAKTRAATAAASRAQAVISLSFEDESATKENHEPINNFHKALLLAKDKDNVDQDTHKPLSREQSEERTRPHPHPVLNKLKNQRIVTIADSPLPEIPVPKVVNKALEPLSAPQFDYATAITETDDRLDAPEPIKELSMIVEDDEIVERSRFSLTAPAPHAQGQVHEEAESMKMDETVFHDAVTHSSHDIDIEMEENILDNVIESIGESLPADATSTSVGTFHDIHLSPRESEEPTSAFTGEFHTAPLPKVSLSPVPVEDEQFTHTGPLPISDSNHEEYTIPLRGEPPVLVPGLSRKPSLSQFAGVPAPSPFRKSLRTPSEAALTAGAGPSAAPPVGKRTSWLSKARETKALETTAKRTSTLGLGITTFGANKRKSSDMLEVVKDSPNVIFHTVEEQERAAKVAKLSDLSEVLSNDFKGKGKASELDLGRTNAPQQSAASTQVFTATSDVPLGDDDELLTTLLKNYGPRTGKSMGKSLGGAAAAEVAEARARAEARVVERLKLDMGDEPGDAPMDGEEKSRAGELPDAPEPAPVPAQLQSSERRFSVSDLVPSSQKKAEVQVKAPPPPADMSTTTTPPDTPPRPRTISFTGPPTGPVFSRPPPPVPGAVATAAPAREAPVRDFKLPTTNPFSIPTAIALGMGPKFVPLSAQSSKNSVFSDIVFDRQTASPASPAWMPSTQDTSYSVGPSQSSQPKAVDNDDDDLGDDDSWGVDEKFASNQMWTPFGFTSSNPDQLKDSITWSTIPSRSTSQKGGDTGIQTTQSLFSSLPQGAETMDEEPEELEPEQGFAERLAAAAQQQSDVEVIEEADIAMEIDEDEAPEEELPKSDLEEVILSAKSTIKLVQPKLDSSVEPRSDSQQSMASTASSQSNLGFFGTASKLVSSVLGGGKKGKTEVKSLQLAAAAAKKQQEELEKKAQRLKEMENRRLQAQQRKADEEKARVAEEERKHKEEADRRRREREEQTDKRPLRSTTAATKKQSEDDTMKRKLGMTTTQKPPSKDKKDTGVPRPAKQNTTAGSSTTSKPGLKSALRQPGAGPSGSSNPSAAKPVKTVKHVPSSNNLKIAAAPAAGPAKGKERDISEQPQSQQPQYPQPTRFRAPGPPAQEPPVASESIELPDINSEYSDSEDEDRPKRDLPDWAKSPDIAAALQQQSTINPDDIFGRIGPLRMEEIFRTRTSRFRARTSSANWSGADELTRAEEQEYARRMGFK